MPFPIVLRLSPVSLPKSLISIGNCSFVNCTALTNLSFPDTLTEIGSLAFGSCSSLQHVILPKGIKEIAESAFAGCANLVSVTCQDSLTIIGYKAFDGCVSLKNLTLSKNLEEIGWAAFRDCRQLNSLALPDRLSTIEYAAFDGCPNLKYLYVPDSVEKIGVGADGTLAFDGETTLICPEGSYAETYAQMYFLTHATGGYSIWNGIVEMPKTWTLPWVRQRRLWSIILFLLQKEPIFIPEWMRNLKPCCVFRDKCSFPLFRLEMDGLRRNTQGYPAM